MIVAQPWSNGKVGPLAIPTKATPPPVAGYKHEPRVKAVCAHFEFDEYSERLSRRCLTDWMIKA